MTHDETDLLTEPATVTDDGTEADDSSFLAKGASVGRYLIAEMIGRGGMGVVYKAFDPELNRPVAIKLLNLKVKEAESKLKVSQNRSRILREAQALAQLSHPNVVTVFDVGTYDDTVFIAMEYIEGLTLRQWLVAGKRSRQDILVLLKAAGRGLASAHAAGIVHRDFKPGNVVVGEKGKVKVLDFGLARAVFPDRVEASAGDSADDADSEPESVEDFESGEYSDSPLTTGSANLLGSSMTQAGSLMGTPSYMSPEQHLKQGIDARSDQFSFCVVLFEVLFGRRPFKGATLEKLAANVTHGRVTVPKQAKVPDWITQVILRGLRVDPDSRYASMEALLAELDNDPAIVQQKTHAARMRILALVSVLFFATLAAVGVWYGFTRGGRLCQGAGQELTGIWDEAVRAQVKQSFLASGRHYAVDTFRRVEQVLDRFGSNWTSMRTEACEATHLEGRQSAQLLDLRMRCLDGKREQLRALLEVFREQVDGKVVDKAVQAALSLAGVDLCADEEALQAAVPPPEDPLVRKQVDELRGIINRAEALYQAGKYQAGQIVAKQVLVQARKAVYPPLVAEALFQLSGLQEKTGLYQEAAQTLQEASQLAREVKDGKLLAGVLSQLVFVTGHRLMNFQDGMSYRRAAEVAIALAAGTKKIQAKFYYNVGNVFYAHGRAQEAKRWHEKALQLFEVLQMSRHPDAAACLGSLGNDYKDLGDYAAATEYCRREYDIKVAVLGPDHPGVGHSLNNLGVVYYRQGKDELARTHYQKAMQLWRQALGPKHPYVGFALNNLGLVYARLGQDDEAEEYFSQAHEVFSDVYGPQHPVMAWTTMGLGEIFQRRGEADRAREYFSRVIALCDQKACEAEPCARARFGMAKILWEGKQDRKRALALAEKARGGFANMKREQSAVEAWLADK